LTLILLAFGSLLSHTVLDIRENWNLLEKNKENLSYFGHTQKKQGSYVEKDTWHSFRSLKERKINDTMESRTILQSKLDQREISCCKQLKTKQNGG